MVAGLTEVIERRHRARRPGSARRRPRSRRRVPVAVLLPWLTARENVALGVDRVYPHAQPGRARATSSTTTSRASASATPCDKPRARAFERHEAARRHRARLRAVAEAAAARRALRHARLAHALGAAGRADGGLGAHPGHRDLRHPRRRRGDPARRPRRDDDERPARASASHRRRPCRGRAAARHCSSTRDYYAYRQEVLDFLAGCEHAMVDAASKAAAA